MEFSETPLHALAAGPKPSGPASPPQLPPADPAIPQPEEEDFPFDRPEKEARFQAAWTALKSKPDPRARPNWWIFGIMVLVFGVIFAQGGNLDPLYFGLLGGVILLHELGHLLGMKFFGYTDVRMFFLPFLGAAVAGKKHTAPAWQQALVILAGPWPGLLLALLWYLVVRDEITSWELHLVVLLLGINLINLLPFEPLDGGRLLHLVLFSRNAWIECMVQLISGAGLAALAWFTGGHYFLWALAVVTLMGVAFRFRQAQMTARLRRDGLAMPATVAELTPLQGRMLFAAAYDVMKNRVMTDAMMAGVMRELHHRVLVPAPRLAATLGFLLLYVGAFAIALTIACFIAFDLAELNDQFAKESLRTEWLRFQVKAARHEVRRTQGPARQESARRLQRLEEELRQHESALAVAEGKLNAFRSLLAPGMAKGPPDADGDLDEEDRPAFMVPPRPK